MLQQSHWECRQGETFRRTLRIKSRSTGLAVDLTGWAFSMSVKISAADSTAIATATLTVRDQVADTGAVDLVIDKAATLAMAVREYKFDLCADASGERRFYATGIFEIKETITK